MRRFTFVFAVLVTSMFFLAGVGFVQQNQHHMNKANREYPESSKAHRMMGHSMMQERMMKNCLANDKDGNWRMMGMMHNMMRSGVMGNMHGMYLHVGSPGFLLRSAEQLNLSDDQVKKLKSLQAEYQKFFVRIQADREVLEIDLRDLLTKESVDYEKAKNKTAQLIDLEKQIRLEQLNKIEQSRKLLTAEQVSKMNELVTGHRMMRTGMHDTGSAIH